MKALVKSHSKTLQLKDIPNPILTNDEDIIVKVDLAGICRTDIYVSRGLIEHKDNLTIGHEFSGYVSESNCPEFKVGDYVACNPIFEDLTMLGIDHDGCFAEYIKINKNYLYKANGIDPKMAAYVEPIAASLAPLKSKFISKDMKGFLYGNNRISQLTVKILKDAGYSVDIIDIEDAKNVASQSYDYGIETFMNTDAFDQTSRILKKGGTLIIKSRNPEHVAVNFYEFVKKEITMEALYYNTYELAIKYAREKSYLFEDLMGDVFSLEDWDKAEKANELATHKIFLKP